MSDVAVEEVTESAAGGSEPAVRSARLTGFLRHEWTLASVGSALLAIMMTWLLPWYASDLISGGVKPATVGNPARTLAGDGGDPAAQAWLIAWDGHALRHGLSGLWNTNAFYPDKDALAFSDMLLGYAPIGLLGNGVTAAMLRYNILFVLTFALVFLGGYTLVRQLGADRVAGTVTGAALAYAPWRYGHVGHLNILSSGGITLAFAMLARGHGWSMTDGYRRDRVRPGWAMAGWLVASWQVSLGFGIGLPFVYLLAVACLAAVTSWVVRGRPPLPRRLIVGDLAGGLFFTATTLSLAYIYQHVRDLYPDVLRQWDYVATFSPIPRSLLVAPASSLWGTPQAAARAALGNADNEKELLCGYMLYLLAFGGLFLSVWSVRQRLGLLTGTVLGVLCAMGTHGPTYRLLFLYVHGFDGGRTPGRLILWPTICLAVLAAGFVTRLATVARDVTLPQWSVAAARVVTVPLLIMVLLEGIPNLAHVTEPGEPAAMAAATAPFIVLPTDDAFDSTAMLWSTVRFPTMVNGTASYESPERRAIREVMHSFPSEASLDRLRQLGVRSVVVLRDRVVGTPFEAALEARTGPGITRREIGGDVLLSLD
ncbi:hypothetical protein [Paractinoplanes durhamensis]|uniref:hypothetical protein n=1 Tax=Paractinoplanes durhamensis TaxID=113563 RepID=UPI001EF349B9|nr:hypothetical protein [Actinoplanes durhamensis]